MNNAGDAPEVVLTSQKEVVYQPPQSPPGEYHTVQQSPGAYAQQQYPQQQQHHHQYEQQQQQQQPYEDYIKPFEGSSYSHNAVSAMPSQYNVPAEPHQERKEKKTVCGLARRTFVFLVILAIVVVVAAVGGAVGGSLSVQRSSQPQAAALHSTASSSAVATPTTTAGGSSSTPTTSSFVSVPSDYGKLSLDCPNLDKTTKKVALGSNTWSFALECGVDYPGAKNDILAVTVYTLDDCLRSCLSYNRNLGRADCVGVAFNADMAGNVEANFGNCWVKNSTSTVRRSNSSGNIGARLQLQ